MSVMKRFLDRLCIVMVFVYSTQSLLAVGAPCFMAASSAAAGADHSGHDMASMPRGDHAMGGMDHRDHAMAQMDAGACCEGGLCSMSHCQTAVAMPASLLPRQTFDTPLYPGANAPALPEPGLASPYRPPILA